MQADLDTVQPASRPILPSPEQLGHARCHLLANLPKHGLGSRHIAQHIENDLVPAFDHHSANYYGFVTGGVTPAALHADHIAVDSDQNIQVYLPEETISVEVEDRALRMLCELVEFDPTEWSARTFTTGATASNVLGLACGRERVLQRASEGAVSVAEDGIVKAMRIAGVEDIQVLTSVPHSSLRKAASIVGIGRSNVVDVGLETSGARHRIDVVAAEAALQKPRTASIVVVSCAEVNTGFFATNYEDMVRLRQLCDQYGAWLHVDAAFGLLARVLPPTYTTLVQGVAGLEFADSIASDAHKLLNVPYDCGIFLSRHLSTNTSVFQNTNANYLAPAAMSANAAPHIPSPLNVGLENSRRFRALPVYATLAAYGLAGYRNMLEQQIALARRIAEYLRDSPAYDLLPCNTVSDVFVIVLFRAKDEKLNKDLVKKINGSRKVYVSGTMWDGRPAARFAVANWAAVVERELGTVKEVLDAVTR